MKSLYLVAVFLLIGCSEKSKNETVESNAVLMTVETVDLSPKKETNRWYSTSQLNEGKALFATNCASCHGAEAEATSDWKKPDGNGNYPPPPLNGTAHGWHHPLSVLDMVIRDGGVPLGGVMPAWKDILSEDERLKVIAGFQHYWSDETYSMWMEREESNRN